MLSARRSLISSAANLGNIFVKNTKIQKMFFNALRLDRNEVRDLILNRDIQFLAYCLSRRTQSKSQILQDLWVCYELGEKTNGYFVEFGATNGLKNSNTWLLEREFGWKGILGEPNPIWHADLVANRRCPIEHKCVSSRSHETVTFIATNDTDPELSGIASSADADHFAETRRTGTRMDIETISLDDLLDKYEAPQQIDYISIDTEGSELNIVSNYSFSRNFQLISIENNSRNDVGIDEILASHGYVRVFHHFSQWDSWYVARALRTGTPPVLAAPNS